jgi:hypothetical protein
MRKLIPVLFVTILFFFTLVSLNSNCFAQCTPQTPIGVNLITNGDFEQGYASLATDYFNHFTQSTANGASCVKGSDCNPPDPTKSCGCSRDYSLPNEYLIGKDVTQLHVNFFPITDHTSGVIGGGQTLFVDGSCSVKKSNGTDYIVWSRTVNIVPNTNYFFSAWVASLGIVATLAPGQVAVLAFKVNGDSLGTLPATSKVGEWVTYTRNWFSGNISGPVTISIVNTQVATCNNGDDFAIDDITFTAGCAFASQGPKPNLGQSFSICDKKLPITLFSGVKGPYTNTNIKWSTGETTPSIKITTAGTYSVCVDSAGSCTRSDIIKITDTFEAEIGPDIRLCNPLYSVLKVNVVDSTNFNSIQWFKDGVALDRAFNSTSVMANAPGTYWVNVNGPGKCSSSDSAVVTSGVTTIPVNKTYCVASGNTTATLGVTGPSTIKWYANATGGVALAKGPSFTTPTLASPGPYTYWAEDTTSFAGIVGESGAGFTDAGYPIGVNNTKESKLFFNALSGFSLDSLTVGYYSYGCTGNLNPPITIVILDANGATVGSKILTLPCSGVQPATARVPIGIKIPKGTNYTITISSGNYLAWNKDGPAGWYPKTYKVNSNDIMTITGNAFDVTYAQWSSPAYYNWKISVNAACGRVPVYANEVCTCKPIIITQPIDTSKCAGSGVSFKVAVNGTAPTFVWQEKTPSGAFVNLSNGGVYSGVNTPKLNISDATGKDQNQYKCIVTGTCGTVTSNPGTLTIPPSTTILTETRDTSVCGTGSANFKIVAQGANLTYVWQEKTPSGSFVNLTNGGVYSGVNTTKLSISDVTGKDQNQYQCIVTGTCLSAISISKTLSVPVNTAILAQPRDTSVCKGSVSFNVVAKGTATTFVWQEKTPSGAFVNLSNGGVYSGVNTTKLIISDVTGKNNNQYQCIVSGTCGSPVTSNPATLTIGGTIPFSTQPKDNSFCGTSNVNFNIVAQGSNLTYKWLEKKPGGTYSYLSDAGKYAGTTTNTLLITAADSTMSGFLYKCEVTSPCTVAKSDSAKITVTPSKITIVTQPTNATICQGDKAQFKLQATGSGITYKWQEKTTVSGVFTNIITGGNYSGADSATLNISSVPPTMNGNQYRCLLTNACGGNATSAIDTLKTLATPLLSLGKDTVYCPLPNSSFILKANAGFASYLWQDNSTDPTFAVYQAGTYSVTGTMANGCKSNASIMIKDCDLIVIPNVITPFNHDTKNDFLFILGNKPGSRIEIYNRWGTLVQKKNPYLNNWAGEDLAGNTVSEGVYFYIYYPLGKAPMVGNVEIIK